MVFAHAPAPNPQGGPHNFVRQRLARMAPALNLTDAQMRDNSLVVPVYAGPSTTSGRVGNASAIVIARSPLHVVNGFAEMLFPNGAAVWIDAKMLRPYHSESNPNAHCTPSLMSNGKPGLG